MFSALRLALAAVLLFGIGVFAGSRLLVTDAVLIPSENTTEPLARPISLGTDAAALPSEDMSEHFARPVSLLMLEPEDIRQPHAMRQPQHVIFCRPAPAEIARAEIARTERSAPTLSTADCESLSPTPLDARSPSVRS